MVPVFFNFTKAARKIAFQFSLKGQASVLQHIVDHDNGFAFSDSYIINSWLLIPYVDALLVSCHLSGMRDAFKHTIPLKLLFLCSPVVGRRTGGSMVSSVSAARCRAAHFAWSGISFDDFHVGQSARGDSDGSRKIHFQAWSNNISNVPSSLKWMSHTA